MMCPTPSFFVSCKRRNLPALAAIATCLLTLPATLPQALAQEGQPLPGCEAPPQLRRELDASLDSKLFDGLKYSDRIDLDLKTTDRFTAKYPREADPSRRLIDLTWYAPGLIPVVKDRFEKRLENNPDDPLAHALAGYSLTLADPQRAIQELNWAKAKAPAFPLPYLLLTEIYSLGATADPKALADNLTSYFDRCPASTDSEAHRLLAKMQDTSVQARIAKALRTRLEKATDVSDLRAYETLWALEFRAHAPQEHATLRRQITADLKRIESLNRRPDAESQAFLVRAYKMSDAPPEKAQAWEDRLLREYPKSSEASSLVQSRWDKSHPEPEDQKDAATWAKWNQEYKAALKIWMHDFPDDYRLQGAWRYAIRDDDNLSEKEVLQIFEADLDDVERSWSPSAAGYIRTAEFLVQHKVQQRRVLDALRLAETSLARQHSEDAWNKNRTPQEEKERKDLEELLRTLVPLPVLGATLQLHDAALAQSVRAEVDGAAPHNDFAVPYYWLNRARLSVVENRKADALAYYQLALRTRKEPPPWIRGKLYDELGDDARSLWQDLGGTDAAFDVWSKPARPQELTEGYWERTTKQMPDFELVDLSGKTWRLKELRGKAVLINVWATWCSACRAELPHVQRLYDRLKDSTDVLVLTLDIDDDPGLVEPYMKEKGYGFPVLPASGFVSSLLNSSPGVPQTWIVDSTGQWLWTQMGFGLPDEWEDIVTNKLKTAEAVN